MKPWFTLTLAVGLLSAPFASAQTVYVVRHAEKADASADPALSPDGLTRASALAASFAAPVDLILTSPLQRTRMTAGPTAERFSVDVRPVTLEDGVAAHLEETIRRLRGLREDQTALVVGHSNTVPLIVRALGAEADDMADCEYDRLTVLTLNGDGASAAVRRYGAPSIC